MQQNLVVAEAFPARPCADAGAVEAWLRHALSDRYDAALSESLPVEMLALLSDFH